ncbi:MAG: gliding motility-associated C-terminal domain-containing protein, partial [Bacteroidia bacterium]|nr:gliding motility-associated C-terminal domain-containing protein [Bacteroidia bacterium]
CNADWPEFLTTSWSDNCSDGGELESDNGIEDGTSEDGCIQYRLYTFTISDSCGNTDTETTRIARENDMTDPEILSVEDFMLESCNADWPEFLTTSWSDNCSYGGDIDSNSGEDAGESEDGCTQYRLYTFTISDSCGNSAMAETLVGREIDMTNPEIIDLDDFTLDGCNLEWPEFLTTTYTDNCSDGGEINSDEGINDGTNDDGSIEYRLYTFTITDDCGNSDTEITRIGRILGSGGIEIGGTVELCRDYGEYDLFELLPDGYISGGTWSLDSSPDDIDIDISESGTIFIFADLLPGDYIFLYNSQSEDCPPLIEVTVILLAEEPPCARCIEGNKITTALTPNGDGQNDTFDAGITTPQRAGCPIVDVQVFNRWGAKIFEAQNYQNDWGGTIKSSAFGSAGTIPAGTYFYILRYSTEGILEETITGYFYVATE